MTVLVYVAMMIPKDNCLEVKVVDEKLQGCQ